MVRLYILQQAIPDLAANGAHFYTYFKMTCHCRRLDTTVFFYICVSNTHCILFVYKGLYMLLHVQPKHSTSHLKKQQNFSSLKQVLKMQQVNAISIKPCVTLHLYLQVLYWSYQLYTFHSCMWNSLTMTQLGPNMHETD